MLTEEIILSIEEAEGYGDWKRSSCHTCYERVGTVDKKKSFGYNIVTGKFICHRCGVKGFDRQQQAKDIDYVKVEEVIEKDNIKAPDGYVPFTSEGMLTARVTEKARQYLTSRGVTQQTWLSAELGITMSGKYCNRIVVPIKGIQNEWLGWQARVWQKTDGLKYVNAVGMDRQNTVFNLSALNRDTQDPLLVVEGTFDALPYYPNACAVLGKPTRGQLRLLAATKRPVVFALDGDAWREGQSGYMALRLQGKLNVGYVKLPPGEDPNTVDKSWLINESNKTLGK